MQWLKTTPIYSFMLSGFSEGQESGLSLAGPSSSGPPNAACRWAGLHAFLEAASPSGSCGCWQNSFLCCCHRMKVPAFVLAVSSQALSHPRISRTRSGLQSCNISRGVTLHQLHHFCIHARAKGVTIPSHSQTPPTLKREGIMQREYTEEEDSGGPS